MVARRWIASGNGLWTDAANWSPTGAPTGADDATLSGPAVGVQTVSGIGAASTLAVLGNMILAGQISTGSLTIGSTSTQGALTLGTGSSLSANTATLLFGP